MKPTTELNKRVINALIDTGLSLSASRSIAYGHKKMNDLERALQLEKYPHYLSMRVWDDLYKLDKDNYMGRNKIEIKDDK